MSTYRVTILIRRPFNTVLESLKTSTAETSSHVSRRCWGESRGVQVWRDKLTGTLRHEFDCTKFYIFLTVHLRIILVDKQLDAQFLLWYVYLNPLHVSSNTVVILRRTIVLIQHLVQSLCVSGRPVYRTATNTAIIPDVVLIQLSSWGWAHSCLKHVEDSNKNIIEETVRHVGYLT